MVQSVINTNGLSPDMLRGCTWKRISATSDIETNECLIEVTTNSDRLAELEAHPGILHIFEYKEQTNGLD